tara:strand:+ start:61516 stop:62568 length:1053 start_codon:yes stop_codon:yes gene_type:complete
MIDHNQTLLALQNVSKRFAKPEDMIARVLRRISGNAAPDIVHAVDDVTFNIQRGEVVGLVGESGCGKSTLGRMAVGLHSLSSGQRRWLGHDIAQLSHAEKHQVQLAMQMIFQDPYASLNPRMRVLDIVGEAPVAHGIITRAQQKDYVEELLQKVGLEARSDNGSRAETQTTLATESLRRFPHQFSGGQRARIGIARALAVKPELLVCDEAVAALDVSIQAQVLNLFMQLRDELGLTYLFISHDLGVVRHISDRVLIMYLGRIVESAPTVELFSQANHPYTIALLASAPTLIVGKRQFDAVKGEIPSPLRPPSGCHFHPRCPHAMPRCSVEQPLLKEIAPQHFSACHLNDQ